MASITGCDNGTTNTEGEPTKFEGTWKNPYAPIDFFYTFTGNSFHFTNDDKVSSGTFTFTETEITFTPSNGKPWTQGYTLSETELNLVFAADSYGFGSFIKQN
jgi:hypothetical protein